MVRTPLRYGTDTTATPPGFSTRAASARIPSGPASSCSTTPSETYAFSEASRIARASSFIAASGTGASRRHILSASTAQSTPAARQPRSRSSTTYWPSPQPASRTVPSRGSARLMSSVNGELRAVSSSSPVEWPPQCSAQKSRSALTE